MDVAEALLGKVVTLQKVAGSSSPQAHTSSGQVQPRLRGADRYGSDVAGFLSFWLGIRPN